MQQLIDLRHETPEAITLGAIRSFMSAGHPAIVLYSGGKDSSVLLNLALTAAAPLACVALAVGVDHRDLAARFQSHEEVGAARMEHRGAGDRQPLGRPEGPATPATAPATAGAPVRRSPRA